MARIVVPTWLAAKVVSVREQVAAERSNPHRKWALVLLTAWIVAGIVTVCVPRNNWNKNKSYYYAMYGRYVEYENNQRAYEQQQNGNNNNNNNNNNNYSYYTVKECSWWQWQCRKQQYYYRQQQNDNRDDMVYTPDWYRFVGGRTGNGEEDDRYYEEMGLQKPEDPSATGAVKFVHRWTQLLFAALLLYGAGVIYLARPINGLVVCMIFFGQFSLLNMILLTQGVIVTDGRQLEDSVYGWSGQLPILMAYTDFAYVLFCFGFCFLFLVRYAVKRFLLARNNRLGGGAAGIAGKDGTTNGNEDDDDEQYTTPAVYKTMPDTNSDNGNGNDNDNDKSSPGYNAMA